MAVDSNRIERSNIGVTQVVKTISEMREWVTAWRTKGETIALVPTMGALHQGHMALVSEAQRRASCVVVSIFVNPLQFGPTEDLTRYPRNLENDVETLQAVGTSVVFAPTVLEMYPDGPSATRVVVESMSQVLCGRVRPTHFQGVTTVVAKLLNIINPDYAIFGEKDWQQLAIIRRMVVDLNIAVKVLGVPIFRDDSGLALSSRNQYLSLEERALAPILNRALLTANNDYVRGERDPEVLRKVVVSTLTRAGLVPEYVELVDPNTLQPRRSSLAGETLLALAVPIGKARLIDNIILGRIS